MSEQILSGIEQVRRRWFWYLLLGISLIIFGLMALADPFVYSMASVVIIGWLIIFSGLAQALMAFRVRNWSGFFLHLMGGVLEIIIGLLTVAAPASAAITVTLLLAVYLLVSGLFRLIATLLLRYPAAGWGVFGALVSFLLGLALWRQWPESGLTFIGICIGITLLLHGISWVAFALGIRKVAPATTG
jgi:uncharacterized membrane protein HdeD (DUF308 family)